MKTIKEKWEEYKAVMLKFKEPPAEDQLQALKHIFYSGYFRGLGDYQTLIDSYKGEDVIEGTKVRNALIDECQRFLFNEDLSGDPH